MKKEEIRSKIKAAKGNHQGFCRDCLFYDEKSTSRFFRGREISSCCSTFVDICKSLNIDEDIIVEYLDKYCKDHNLSDGYSMWCSISRNKPLVDLIEKYCKINILDIE